jgi:hypothetical protein
MVATDDEWRTLRGFIGSYYELVATIRDFMLPNPDVR